MDALGGVFEDAMRLQAIGILCEKDGDTCAARDFTPIEAKCAAIERVALESVRLEVFHDREEFDFALDLGIRGLDNSI